MISRTSARAVLNTLSGDVALMCGDAEIEDAGRLRVDLRAPDTLEFGPAPSDWEITGFAVYGSTGSRRLTGTIDPTFVWEGQCFALTISADVTND